MVLAAQRRPLFNAEIWNYSMKIYYFNLGLYTAIKGNKTAFDITEASFLAENKLEELLTIPFASVSDTKINGSGRLDNNTVSRIQAG